MSVNIADLNSVFAAYTPSYTLQSYAKGVLDSNFNKLSGIGFIQFGFSPNSLTVQEVTSSITLTLGA